MSELKPCPFCAREPEMLDAMSESWVHCRACGATGPTATGPDAAAKRWNRRPGDAKVELRDARADRLAALLDRALRLLDDVAPDSEETQAIHREAGKL